MADTNEKERRKIGIAVVRVLPLEMLRNSGYRYTCNQLADFVNELAQASTSNRGMDGSLLVHRIDAKTFEYIASSKTPKIYILRESLNISIHVHNKKFWFFFGNGNAVEAPEANTCPSIRRIPDEVKADIFKALSFTETIEEINDEGYSKGEEAAVKSSKSSALDDILQGLADVLRTVHELKEKAKESEFSCLNESCEHIILETKHALHSHARCACVAQVRCRCENSLSWNRATLGDHRSEFQFTRSTRHDLLPRSLLIKNVLHYYMKDVRRFRFELWESIDCLRDLVTTSILHQVIVDNPKAYVSLLFFWCDIFCHTRPIDIIHTYFPWTYLVCEISISILGFGRTLGKRGGSHAREYVVSDCLFAESL